MLRIEIENRRQSLLFAVAFGCVLLLAVGVTLLYWTSGDGRYVGEAERGIPEPVDDDPMSDEGVGERNPAPGASHKSTPFRATGSVSSRTPHAYDSSSLWFFGTLVCALVLLFGLTFRYYSYREMKAAEKRWMTACEEFLARIEIERTDSEEKRLDASSLWAAILSGQGAAASGTRGAGPTSAHGTAGKRRNDHHLQRMEA